MSTAFNLGLDLTSKKVTAGTQQLIRDYVRANSAEMSAELLDFYSLLRAMIGDQLRKPAARRANMQELMRRAYNLDAIIVEQGAISSELVSF